MWQSRCYAVYIRVCVGGVCRRPEEDVGEKERDESNVEWEARGCGSVRSCVDVIVAFTADRNRNERRDDEYDACNNTIGEGAGCGCR